jgi:LysM repeat protein
MLEKARIRPETPAGSRPIEVLFNPTQYGLESSSQYAETAVLGLSAPILQYTRGNSRSLSMELFFDTYEQRTDVRRHTDGIYKLLDVEASTHRPPIVHFAWGRLDFRCVVERVSGRFTLFLDSGVPVRATLTVTLREYVDPREASRSTKLESPDRTKTYVVKLGDSLGSIAAAEYGDPAAWRPIAAANGIDNPRVLAPGRRLAVPAIPAQGPAA